MTLCKGFPFPVLSPDNMDYIDDVEYSASISYKEDVGIYICHEVKEGNFVSGLISQNSAKFACLVSQPASLFRKIFIYDGDDGKVIANQKIISSDFYSPEILAGSLFRPMVVATKDINENIHGSHCLDSACWGEGEIIIPRGGIVAFDNWKYLENNAASSMFVFKPSEALSIGQIDVIPNTDNGGFKFVVNLRQEMLSAMQSSSNKDGVKEHMMSICTHALSRGFEILAKDYYQNWEDHLHLKILATEFEVKGIPHWSTEGFKPEMAATAMYPHSIPNNLNGGDDE